MGTRPKIQATLFFTLIFLLITISGYFFFLQSQYFETFHAWSQQNIVLYCVVLFILKVCAIVYAPLPGGLLSLGSIPFLGWKLTYIVDFIGSLVGGSIAYYLGKRYGLVFMKHIFDEQTLSRIQQIKMNSQREAEGIFVMRVLTGSSLLDALCYAAGFLRIKYRNFLVGSVLSHLVVGIPTFYLSESIFTLKLQNLGLNLIGLLIPLLVVYHLRHRYFDFSSEHTTGPS